MNQKLFEDVSFDNILRCVHCGLCLDACPTYRALGTEQDSPRGRLYLMRGLWEGELDPDETVLPPLNRCLDCRACETSCPSNVPYGELLEKTRGVVIEKTPAGKRGRFWRWLAFRALLPRTGRLLFLSRLAKLYRLIGLSKLISSRMFEKILPRRFVAANRRMPGFDGLSFKRRFSGVHEPRGQSSVGTVAFFSGCVMDVADTRIHNAGLELLLAAGYRVWIPPAQSCCGALAVHAGERVSARELAKVNLNAFSSEPFEALILDSAGCGAHLRDMHHLFGQDSGTAQACRSLGSKVRDILGFLNERPDWINRQTWKEQPQSVLYDAPCHLVHAQRAGGPHFALLRRIPGLTVHPLADADQCCGAAGIYNLLQTELADQVLSAKLDDLEASLALNPDAKILVTGNPGCLYQLRAGVAQRGFDLQVMHPAELIASRLIR